MQSTNTVFLSHSHDDQGFTEFIAELLNAHDLNPWHSGASVESGSRFQEGIEKSIKNSCAMIVIASENALNSRWMTREITLFINHHPNSPIIPIKVENVDLDKIYDGLSSYQYVDFKRNPTSGLKMALKTLNRILFKFDSANKNHFSERRTNDRRKNPPEIKLRDGLWIAFSRVTELGKFENFDFSVVFPRTHMDLIGAMHAELLRYLFTDSRNTEKRYSFSETEALIAEAWESMLNRRYSTTPIIMIEEIVRKIRTEYSIKTKDRRASRTSTENSEKTDTFPLS